METRGETPKRRKSWTLRIAVLLGLAGGAFVLLSVDGAPPEDADLFSQSPVGEGPDAMASLRRGAALIGDEIWPNHLLRLRDRPAPKNKRGLPALLWNRAEAETLLADKAAAIAAYESAVEGRFDFSGAEPGDPKLKLLTEQGRRLRELVEIRIRLHLEQGRLDEAVDDALLIGRLGAKIRAGRGALDFASRGRGEVQRALGLLIVMLQMRPGFKAETLRRAAAAVEALQDHKGQDLIAAFKAEYRADARALNEIAAGEGVTGVLSWGPLRRLSFHENRVRAQIADDFRRAIALADEPLSAMALIEEPTTWTLPPGIAIYTPNGAGRRLVKDVRETCRSWLTYTRLDRAVVAMTRALLLLRAYEIERGALPPKLEALVPEYWPAVPKDPFDGAPLRYDLKKRWVYSVGQDLKDEGGLEDQNTEPLREPTFGLDAAGSRRKKG